MHQNLVYLFSAFAGTWLLILAYVFYIQMRLKQTREHIRWLEEDAESRTEKQ